MTTTEYIKKLEDFKKDLPKAIFSKLTAWAWSDIRGMVENRVEQTQTNARGGKFSKYSTRPMLTSGNTKKSANVWRKMAGSKEKRKELNWVTLKKKGKNIHLFELPGGYAELRRLENFTNVNKSFEFTGAMWDQWGPLMSQCKVYPDGFLVRMGGMTEYSQELINKHSQDEGIDIIDMSNEEIKTLCQNVDIWILQELKKYGLS
jgi:hypothetical protein